MKMSNITPEKKSTQLPRTLVDVAPHEIRTILKKFSPVIAGVVPNKIDPNIVLQTAAMVINAKPKLRACSLSTIMGSVVQSANLGLSLTPSLGQAYLVPFKGQATLIIGYRGLATLMYRSPRVATVDAKVVCKDDHFDFKYGTNKFLDHSYNLKKEEERGDMLGAYAIIDIKSNNQYQIFEVADKDTIMKHKAASPARNSDDSPWNGPFEESMWRKTALIILSKIAPFSIEEQASWMIDNSVISIDDFDSEGRIKEDSVQKRTEEIHGAEYEIDNKSNTIKNRLKKTEMTIETDEGQEQQTQEANQPAGQPDQSPFKNNKKIDFSKSGLFSQYCI